MQWSQIIFNRQYLDIYRKMETKFHWYSCGICQSRVKHQKSTIVKHLVCYWSPIEEIHRKNSSYIFNWIKLTFKRTCLYSQYHLYNTQHQMIQNTTLFILKQRIKHTMVQDVRLYVYCFLHLIYSIIYTVLKTK